MDFNLIRIDIENELEGSEREIVLVLDGQFYRDTTAQRKATVFVQGVYQSIALNIKRHRRMVIKWDVHGQMHLVIESLLDAKRRGKG
jgi:hypothetical protein